MELETVERCDLCDGTRFLPRKVYRDQLLFGPERWPLVECASCSLLFLNPRPTRASIGQFYPSDYSAHFAAPTTPKAWHRRVASREAAPLGAWQRLLTMVRQDVSWYRFPSWHGEGRVLDVGCGSGGRYLDILRALGWRTHGVEPSEAAVANARSKGHDAVVGTAEERHFPAASMDVVTIWHTLEHTHSPRLALSRCREALVPGGRLSLCVPNFSSLQRWIFGPFWWSTDAPRHLFQFTRKTLGRLLEDTGFRVLGVTTRDGSTSVQRALRHLLNRVFGTRWAHDAPWAVALFEPFAVMGSFFRYFGVGSELRVICQAV